MEETNPMQQPIEGQQEVETNAGVAATAVEAQTAAEASAPEVQATAEAAAPAAEQAETTAAPEAEKADTQAAIPAAEQPATTEAQAEEHEPEVDYSTFTREELVGALGELLNDEVQKIRSRVGSIRTHFNDLNRESQRQAFEAFLAAGGNKDEYKERADSVAEAFYHLYDQYRARRQQYMDNLEAQKRKNLEAKRALIDELRELADAGDDRLRAAQDKFNDIQERWKSVGEVPRDQMNDLWQNYHFQIDRFFKRQEQRRVSLVEDQKRNLEQKIQLCEQAEDLIVEPSTTKAFKALQELRARWREIGPVPTEQNEEIWQRFQAAAQQIDDHRREFYEQRKEELDNNLLAKQALIDKAVELSEKQPTSVKEWNEQTAAFDELLKVWKTIGSVPREVNEEVWTKFKGIIDKHYEQKKEYFGNVRDEQNLNYQKKLELCLKAEAIAKRDDWKKATEELLQLQQEWKSIGATSRKVSEKVWQRFRSACDEFFAKKGEYFKERRSSEGENLVRKQALIEELKAHVFGENREENLAAIKDFQRRWAEVGFVPMAEKERLQKEFRGEIDRIFEQLKISAREAEETAYRERIRNAAGDAKRFVSSERQELQERIEKLRSDLSLWENNLGFLASSKQADLLKQEFEKKMQGARQQIALMQAKLRILNEAERAEKAEKEASKEADANAEK